MKIDRLPFAFAVIVLSGAAAVAQDPFSRTLDQRVASLERRLDELTARVVIVETGAKPVPAPTPDAEPPRPPEAPSPAGGAVEILWQRWRASYVGAAHAASWLQSLRIQAAKQPEGSAMRLAADERVRDGQRSLEDAIAETRAARDAYRAAGGK